jgi:hypothetical protein
MLDAITGAPAVIRNGRHDLLAMNHLGRVLYSPVLADARRPANTARFMQIRGDAELVEEGGIDHLDTLTRKYTTHPRYYGHVYPAERKGANAVIRASTLGGSARRDPRLVSE